MLPNLDATLRETIARRLTRQETAATLARWARKAEQDVAAAERLIAPGMDETDATSALAALNLARSRMANLAAIISDAAAR